MQPWNQRHAAWAARRAALRREAATADCRHAEIVRDECWHLAQLIATTDAESPEEALIQLKLAEELCRPESDPQLESRILESLIRSMTRMVEQCRHPPGGGSPAGHSGTTYLR